ncbi:symmetrical bis(5'-nucleosyl)-tetraphosphatase [Blochmannia endosymbiont of Camponotus sp.]|uniref:symmetrical bis(5'-nucleosyl)-tetraphosphatase n=1 Tax=Blochmannia endosymbiont of Camponotus sp. TaxID=700220 RepID=UPI002024CB07|nr:symmetrical bis(5'-nucleosyl)-tetraphosphatase [Blochmannia endosymbiont of Camponotus sp.]URJ30234.1 symmetrical bis(5'-nucleosyl)-tetraphosphatase [Blochmannia endosymbiont of Camponotus sp.]
MSTYFIGDVHGCYKNLRTMLDRVCFNPNVDTLHLTGDIIARGPSSLEVLRLIHNFNSSARLVLGNHELHLLKTYFGMDHKNHKDYFNKILNAPDLEELMYWLRHQPILYIDENKKIIMTHAGISPNWNICAAKKNAQEIEKILVSDYPYLIFKNIYKDVSADLHQIQINKKKLEQIQEYINVFTRMRYVYLNGQLDLKYKGIPKNAPKNIYPWFSLKKLIDPTYNIIFGHWAALKNIQIPSGIYGLDSGCCWGGALTLLRWENKETICIPCNPPA